MKRWRGQDFGDLPERTRKLLWGSGDKALHRSMSPDDMAAIMKEGRGVKIYKADGSLYDHFIEAGQAVRATHKQIEAIHDRLAALARSGRRSGREVALLQEKASDLGGAQARYWQLTGAKELPHVVVENATKAKKTLSRSERKAKRKARWKGAK